MVSLRSGRLEGTYSKKPIDLIDGQLMPLDLATDEIIEAESKYYTNQGWSEISRDEYYDSFECLPPYAYVSHNGANGFLMSEFTSGPFTGLFVKYSGKYYCCTADAYNPKPMINKLIGSY
jgi:hypothetical protein